jgi:hypothetical protein
MTLFLAQSDLVTVWTPLQQVALNEAPLAVCGKSHLLPGFAGSSGSGNTVTSGTRSATSDTACVPHAQITTTTDDELPRDFETYAPQLHWYTARFRPGDVVVFHARTVHASLPMSGGGGGGAGSADDGSRGEHTPTAATRSVGRISLDSRWAVPSLAGF